MSDLNTLLAVESLQEVNAAKNRVELANYVWDRFGRMLLAVLWLPTFFTSIWLWLYAASGFLLKIAHRSNLGFIWFNRHFDIDKKPLQSMGIVAAVLVAVVYWTTAALVNLMVG